MSASQAESVHTGSAFFEYALTISSAKACGEYLLTIINDILDFTKLGEQKVELEKVPFVLRTVVETCLATYAGEACKKGVELICDFPTNQEDGLIGDPSRISQVLLNMISNAVKFSDKHNGEVVVTVKTAPPGADEFDTLVSIRDNGIGIPGCARDRLFEPFMQADSSITRKYGGQSTIQSH